MDNFFIASLSAKNGFIFYLIGQKMSRVGKKTPILYNWLEYLRLVNYWSYRMESNSIAHFDINMQNGCR